MEAAASPLPSEETTPPVTRMYLTGLPTCWRGMRVSGVASCPSLAPVAASCVKSRSALRAAIEAVAHARRDPRGVSTPIESCRVSTALIRMPCSSARSCSSASERSIAVGGSAASREQAVPPVDVETDVPPRRRGGQPVARERDRRAREVQREAVGVDDDLGDVRIVQLRRDRRSAAAACSSRATGRRERRDRLVDHLRLDQRLVTLHVDDQIAVQRPRQPPRADRCRSGAPATSSAPRRRTLAPHRRSARRRSRRSPRRSSAPRRRADRRARSSAGRRCRPAPFPGRRVD